MRFKVIKILNTLKYQSIHSLLNLGMILLWATLPFNSVHAQTAKEYELKSVILEKISRFVTWPENSGINDKSSPFIIGVLGKNPFENTLERIFSSYTIQNKKVQIKYYTDLADIKQCHLLFISGSEKGNITKLIEFLENKPILLVGDTKGYEENGIHIFFYINKENELRFKINIDSMRRSHLSAGSFLLDYANKE